MAKVILTVSAIQPISNGPTTWPAPLVRLFTPTMRPLIPAGEDNNKMVLCIVLKPDCAIPARSNSAKFRAGVTGALGHSEVQIPSPD